MLSNNFKPQISVLLVDKIFGNVSVLCAMPVNPHTRKNIPYFEQSDQCNNRSYPHTRENIPYFELSDQCHNSYSKH